MTNELRLLTAQRRDLARRLQNATNLQHADMPLEGDEDPDLFKNRPQKTALKSRPLRVAHRRAVAVVG